MRQPRISHEASRGIRQFAFLEMESRIRESVEVTRMVVVQVCQDDILDFLRSYVERTERLYGTTQERALSPLRDFRVETGVDDKAAASPLCQPHEVVHRHRTVVRIAADEMLAPPRIAGSIAD